MQQATRVLVGQIGAIACLSQARKEAQRFGIVDQRADAALRLGHGQLLGKPQVHFLKAGSAHAT